MKQWVRGVVIAVVQVGLVASLGAKLLYDRAVRPRVWALTTPFDPDLPIRGRYVSLQLVVEPRGLDERPQGPGWAPGRPVTLRVENDRLVVEAVPQAPGYRSDGLHVSFVQRQEQRIAVLQEPVAFFIPEDVPDPSRRQPDEGLWVEVTLPKNGPPRPIRLGVSKAGGPIMPLDDLR